ncbi:MAG TPA: phospho-sugar mutase, partial [Actinomycetaceae bacterium]|nr:phospho-sugar mutase [Actinomycetaceae bacterium]
VVAAEQAEPDPAFPTLPYPNPEEPGALDAVLRLAVRQRADLVIAHDPDGDRCAVAVPDPHSAGGWRRLTGDELGALLGQQAAIPAAMAGRGVLASTIVSSRLLPRIAAAHGLRHATTLTGFKWISRTPGLSFGYEEALGYCVDPAAVRDKDGISAALRVVYLWSQLTDRGETLLDALDDLALTHGLHATDQLALRLPGNGDIAAVMARLRAAGPASLAGSAVVDARDLLDGDGEVPPTDGLAWTTRADDRLVVRPSGTEPKLKCYLEVVIRVANRDALPRAREQARERLARLRAETAALVAPVPSEFA